MPLIKVTDSKNITVENCDVSFFGTAIELENVEGFVSKNNIFSEHNDPRLLLIGLSEAVRNSGLDESSKNRLVEQIRRALSSSGQLQKEASAIKNSLKFVGGKALDFFVQLSAAVAAGLVIR